MLLVCYRCVIGVLFGRLKTEIEHLITIIFANGYNGIMVCCFECYFFGVNKS